MAGVRFESEVNLIIIDFYLNYSILKENSKRVGGRNAHFEMPG